MHRMPGIVSALGANHHICLFGQNIYDFAFAFVAPLSADQYRIRHKENKIPERQFGAKRNSLCAQKVEIRVTNVNDTRRSCVLVFGIFSSRSLRHSLPLLHHARLAPYLSVATSRNSVSNFSRAYNPKPTSAA